MSTTVRRTILYAVSLKGEFGSIFTTDYIYDEALTLAMVLTGNKGMAEDISDVMLITAHRDDQH